MAMYARATLRAFAKILGVYGRRYLSRKGVVSNIRMVSISGLDTSSLCITTVDLQRAFGNQPGYQFRPLRVRTSNRHPDAEELAKLGGQWFGYEVYVFAGSPTGQFSGRMSFTFQFKARQPHSDRTDPEARQGQQALILREFNFSSRN